METEDFVKMIALNYVSRVLLNLPFVATPIAAVIILRPVRLVMKSALKKVFRCCCKGNVVHPTTEPRANTL